MHFSINFGRDYVTFDSFTILILKVFISFENLFFKFEKKLAIPSVFTQKK